MSVSLTYGSVCSGVEAASLAWEPLGLKPLWFAEIEDFPSHVLAQRWPHVPNLGDMTAIAQKILSGEVEAPDVLVGGTPCQAFSIAGLRQGLNDERGLLTLKFVELADAIDTVRAAKGLPPVIIIWENVPGVLSSHDNAFGNFTAALVGEPEPFEPGKRPAAGKASQYWTWNAKAHQHVSKWSKHGAIAGRKRRLAWAIKDAQYFGVAQRRRRCFVIASTRNDLHPSQVLFESGCVPRDIAPSREKGQEIASNAGASPSNGSHWDNAANPHPTLNQAHNTGGIGASNQEIFSQRGAGIVAPCLCYGLDEKQNAGFEIIGTLKARETGGGFEGTVACLQCHAFRMRAFGEYADDETASTVKARDYKDATDLAVTYSSVSRTLLAKSNDSLAEDLDTYVIHGTQDPICLNGLAHTLGRNQGQENALIAFSSKDSGHDASYEMSPTLRACNSVLGNQNAGGPPAIAFAQNERGEVRYEGGDGSLAGTLSSGGGKPGQGYTALLQYAAVRRLTPVECERLQGMPDGHTLIHALKRKKLKADEIEYLRHFLPGLTDEELQQLAADGPRYKAIGNSMAVPVMRWLMKGILFCLKEANQSDSVVESQEPERSIFKWAGGKFGVLPTILPLLPAGKRLIEPFVGGGAVFTNAGYGRNLLNDVNGDLINAFKMLAQKRHTLITLAYSFFTDYNSHDSFEDVKAKFNAGKYTPLEHAAAFIYLNRHCFNGLTRYNLKKEFNVGYGKYKKPYFPLNEMEAFLGIADRCEFVSSDFESVIDQARDGDVVFCDPPYEPLPGTDGFTRYSGTRFTFEDQVRLVESLVRARARGAQVVITNSSAPLIQDLYTLYGFTIHQLVAKRSMSCKGNGRVKAHDVIATLA